MVTQSFHEVVQCANKHPGYYEDPSHQEVLAHSIDTRAHTDKCYHEGGCWNGPASDMRASGTRHVPHTMPR